MSVFFNDQHGSELWNPGSLSARLFVEHAGALERALEGDSGVGPIVADEVTVDTDRLRAFIDLCDSTVSAMDSSAADLIVSWIRLARPLLQQGPSGRP
jgi:hypothetical protein